jgi:hypothetical protein
MKDPSLSHYKREGGGEGRGLRLPRKRASVEEFRNDKICACAISRSLLSPLSANIATFSPPAPLLLSIAFQAMENALALCVEQLKHADTKLQSILLGCV